MAVTVYLASYRPDGLVRLIESLHATCKDPPHIIAACDIGDDNIKRVQGCTAIEVPTTYPFSSVAAVNFAINTINPSSHMWVMNDDAIVVSSGWDEEVQSLPQGYLGIPSNSFFPVLTRKHFDVFGWLFPPEFVAWGADLWIHNLYARIGRTKQLGISVVHDQTATTQNRMRRLSGDYERIIRELDLDAYARRLL